MKDDPYVMAEICLISILFSFGFYSFLISHPFPQDLRNNDTSALSEIKYPMICHAEENAIMHAARTGISLKDCVAYVTWPPCTRCARSLIQAGVSEIVYPREVEIPDRWEADFDMSLNMFKESKTLVRKE